MSAPHPFPAVAEEVLILGGCAALRRLFESSLVELFTFRCLEDSSVMRGEREHLQQSFGMAFRGASQLASGAHVVQQDPGSAVWHQVGQGYRPRHPWGCGCHGIKIRFAAGLAEELNFPSRACSLRSFQVPPASLLAARRLVAGILHGGLEDSLAIEEALVRIAGDVLARVPLPSAASRGGTAELHDRCVARARGYLQENFRERVRLAQLARAACASPDHLTRIFRRQTGVTLYQYLLRLRLAAGLDALAAGADDLTHLALDLGFASHSHFTLAFRRRFGTTPAAARNELARGCRATAPC
jgi:AraC family transcriptional regulator